MPKLTVNNEEVEFEDGMTLLQVCELAGEEIPRFCYHERLSIAGNCRMCLVEVEPGPPKPAASCAMPAADGMKVRTNSAMVKKAREGVMEFLLINHPLDCPICDQGGECDLQDQSMTYGGGTNRFAENKRSVKDKYMGPLIKPHMTRCIHCTRCIRFLDDVAGVHEMGAVNRGEDMEVGTFVGKSISSELSGNVIDLCPVGALTSKPYAFKARSWELRKTESIDVMDAVGSSIRVDSRGNEVMRILPRLNEDINEEWISDKTRFAYDGLKTQRLDQPYIRRNGKLEAASWGDALEAVADRLEQIDGSKIAAIAGDMADCESMLLLKELLEKFDSPHIDCRQDGAKLFAGARASYLFNTTIAGIEEADTCLLIGANPRYEAPMVNVRLRKRWLRGGFEIAAIGAEENLTYKVNNLGDSPEIIGEILSGKHKFADVLKKARKPIVIIGEAALLRPDGAAIIDAAQEICKQYGMLPDGESEGWNGFNVLHSAASRVGGMDIGFVPGDGGYSVAEILDAAESEKIELVYLLGADEIDTSKLRKSFVIYQGHHGDAGAHAADVILPAAAYTEKNATYVNLEGRAQRTRQAIFPPGEAWEDWKIIQALSEKTAHKLPYENLTQIREKLAETAPHFAEIGEIIPTQWENVTADTNMSRTAFTPYNSNFYMTNPICRASKTMASCSAEFVETSKEAA